MSFAAAVVLSVGFAALLSWEEVAARLAARRELADNALLSELAMGGEGTLDAVARRLATKGVYVPARDLRAAARRAQARGRIVHTVSRDAYRLADAD